MLRAHAGGGSIDLPPSADLRDFAGTYRGRRAVPNQEN